MSQRERTVIERVGDWKMAFDAISAELTPDPFRALASMANLKPEEASAVAIQAGMVAARICFENDRTAAQVAEAMTRNGLTRERTTD